jgi:hypothetical protein
MRTSYISYLAAEKVRKGELTICLSEDYAVYDIGTCVPAGVPRILETGERTPVETCIRVRDVSD